MSRRSRERSPADNKSHPPPRADCPKHMVYGPCGGVMDDARCEVDTRRCPFHDAPASSYDFHPRYQPRPVPLGRALIDLRLPEDDTVLAEIATIFGGVGATALVGEHLDDPVGTTPADSARRLADVGLPSIVTVSGRRRSPAEHVAEIERLEAAGVVAVHCVTGDHPAVRFGSGFDSEFTLDGTRLAARARAGGALVSACESPAAPPVAARPGRVALKEAAGADLVVLNHAGDPDVLVAFADRCRAVGATLALVAPVPVITDHQSAAALAQFPGLVLPDGLVATVLEATDPVQTGIGAAIELAHTVLSSGRFGTVNLSGSAGGSSPIERAKIMSAIAAALIDIDGRDAAGSSYSG